MFERDVQPVLDEYLAGLVREGDLLQDARPWANYRDDYRVLVEFAKEVGLPVIAANAPRRYVGAVGRRPGVLEQAGWPLEVATWLPPLPLPTPSAAYLEHLHNDPAVVRGDQIGLDDEFGLTNHGGKADSTDDEFGLTNHGGKVDDEFGLTNHGGKADSTVPGQCPYIGLQARDGLLEPMLLWDATMAHALVRSLEKEPDRLLVHVCAPLLPPSPPTPLLPPLPSCESLEYH